MFVTKGIRHAIEASEDFVSLNFLVTIKTWACMLSSITILSEKLLLAVVSEEGLWICSSVPVESFNSFYAVNLRRYIVR